MLCLFPDMSPSPNLTTADGRSPPTWVREITSSKPVRFEHMVLILKYSTKHAERLRKIGWIRERQRERTLPFLSYQLKGTIKELKKILVRERTTPPLRLPNICPPNLSLLCLQYTPTTWLSDRAGGGRGWVGKSLEEAGGCCPFSY